jgi:membrane protease YdiL (CAAX protease family)
MITVENLTCMNYVPGSRPNSVGALLASSKLARSIEVLAVFGAASVVIFFGLDLTGGDLFAKQLVVVAANAVMLALVWLGLRLRGQRADYLGLSMRFASWKAIAWGFAKSLAVLIMAMAGFIFGSIIMMNLAGAPQQADVSGYDYLQGNPTLFLVSLASIYFFSSFGEEVVYRGFLITRLEDLFGGDRKALVLAVVASSLVFGLAHFGWGVTGMVQTAFMGLAMAISFVIFERNLWVLVATHAYMDSALIWPLYLGKP